MRLLDLPQARYFCVPSPAIAATVTSQSLASFHGSLGKGVGLLREGTLRFNIHQVSLLDSIHRWLVYSLGHYRRSIDMLVPVSAPWAQVTLYYASFFAANAILGMFGCWIGHTQTGSRVVDVESGVAGSQELRIFRTYPTPNGAKGSHRVFWDLFYDGAATIAPWAPARLASALGPVNGNYAWQIVERNEVNYDMFHAWSASSRFYSTFKPSRLKTLDGPLQLQFDATERLIKLALHFASDVALSSTVSLSGCGIAGTRRHIQKRLASQASPRLVTQSEFYRLLDV